MALSASRTTIDVTNTATKAIAPQNDFLPNVSIKPSIEINSYARFDASKQLSVQPARQTFFEKPPAAAFVENHNLGDPMSPLRIVPVLPRPISVISVNQW